MNSNPLLLARSTVAHIVGADAAALLLKIDHEALEYGRDWRMNAQAQAFTAEGCERIAAELDTRGHPAAAERLRTALKNARAACAEPVVGELRHVEHVEPDETAMAMASRSRRHYSDVEATPFNAE